MRIRVLGAGAGGGFPQWNCACATCNGVRQGTIRARPRTQSQVAVSPDDRRWFLLNASPDLRSQIEATRRLWPDTKSGSLRHSPIQSVILTNADLDHVLGLLLMRESQPLRIYATDPVKKILLEDNSMFRMLSQHAGQTTWARIEPGRAFEIHDASDLPSGLICEPIALPGKFPIYVRPERAAKLDASGCVLGLVIRSGPKAFAYLPGLPVLDEGQAALWLERLESCDVLFCDGTFWSEDELKSLLGRGRTAREMGHLPISGPGGSLELLGRLKKPEKVYIHINNTNPVLDEESPAHLTVRAAGVKVGFDGMEFEL